MTRLGVAVETPHALGALLPALYQEDELAQRLTQGFDAVLAPVLCVLDCIESYFDPDLAPEDFVAWLASAVGVESDESLPMGRLRSCVSAAADTYRWHGTTRSITAAVAAVSGGEVTVTDSGGATWTRDPATSPPDLGIPLVEVFVRDAAPGVGEKRLASAIEAAKPAHVHHRLTVAGGEP